VGDKQMTNKEIVADAIKEISKEKQEAEIKKIKDIVRTYLEKIQQKKEKEDEVRKERLALEKDLDDLKAGRLDKIEERQGKDPIHDKVTIIEIHRIEKEYIPYQPWRSPWIVEYRQFPYGTSISYTSNTSSLNNQLLGVTQSLGMQCSSVQTTGAQWQNFVGGNYQVGSNNINL
jgi:hypothetical protein